MKTANDISARILRGGVARIGYIDALKGFAILCVVLGHVLNDYLKNNTYPEANPVFLGLSNPIYAFHMPLFMMLSGYVYREAYPIDRKPERKQKLYQQTGNLLAVYLLYSVAFVLLKLPFNRFVNNPMTFSTILTVWVRPITPYWYLYDLILFYCVFSWKPLRQTDTRLMLCILSALSLLSSRVTVDIFQLSNLLYYALFFYMGGVIHERPERFSGKNVKMLLFTALSSLVLYAISLLMRFYAKDSAHSVLNFLPIVNVLVGLCISLTLWQLFQSRRFLSENRFLKTIGRYSLEIYVIHCVLITGFRVVLPRLGVTNALLGVLISFTLSTAIPVFLALLAKRLNLHTLFFRPVTFFAECRAKKETA